MLNTYNSLQKEESLEAKENKFLASLKGLPVLVVIRPKKKDLEPACSSSDLFDLFDQLVNFGIQHIEIAWSDHPCWKDLIKEIKRSFPEIYLGAASVTHPISLECVSKLDLLYATTPFWDLELQLTAQKLNQILIPGVLTPTEIKEASNFGCRILKLFPAAYLGINYWSTLKHPFPSLPFVIAAGGIRIQEISEWLMKGYDAIAIGQSVIKNYEVDPALVDMIEKIKKQSL